MMRIHVLQGCVAAGLVLSLGAPALAAECTSELNGNAELQRGVIRLTSDNRTTDPEKQFGELVVDPNDPLTFEELTYLGTEYNLTDDGAGGGSPRFQIALDEDGDGTADGNVFVYLGTAPNFTDPGRNRWVDSGNLLGNTGGRFDYSQLVEGTQVSTYADALADLGDAVILDVSLVVDSGWGFADKEQTVLFRNVQVGDCIAFDADGDTITDDLDRFPDSDIREFVDLDGGDDTTGVTGVPNGVFPNGYTLQDLVNRVLASQPKNHGQFVSAIGKIANDAVKARILTNAEANLLKRAAAQSNIGKGGNNGSDKPGNSGGNGNKGNNGNKGGNGKGKGK